MRIGEENHFTLIEVWAMIGMIDLFTPLSSKGDFFPDKVRPDAAGHRLMAETIHAAIIGKQCFLSYELVG
jgi:hypothetical protein